MRMTFSSLWNAEGLAVRPSHLLDCAVLAARYFIGQPEDRVFVWELLSQMGKRETAERVYARQDNAWRRDFWFRYCGSRNLR